MSRSHLVMMVILIALLAFYGLSEKIKENKAEQEAQQKRLFADIEEGAVTKLEVTKKAGQDFTVEIRDGRWLYQDQLLASDKISSVAEDLGQLSHERVLVEAPAEKDLKEFGFDEPSYRVDLTTGSGASYLVVLGRRTPDGNNFYARSGDQGPIYVVNGSFGAVLEQDLSELREKSPLPVIPAQVTGLKLVTLEGTSFDIEGQKDEAPEGEDEVEPLTEFRLKEPIQADADRQAVNDYLWGFKSMQAGRFLTDDDKVRWEPLELRLEVQVEGLKEPYILEVGPPVPVKPGMYYARRLNPEERFVLDFGDKVESLLKPTPRKFRDRHLVDFEVDQVKKVTGQIASRVIQAEQGRLGWSVEGAQGEESTFTDLLWQVKETQWEEQGSTPLEAPTAELEFFDGQGNRLAQLRLGKFDNGKTVADRGQGQVFLIEGNTLEKLTKTVQPIFETASPTPSATPKEEE